MSHLRVRKATKKDKKGKINTYKNGRRFYKAETFDSEKEAKAWEGTFRRHRRPQCSLV